MGFHCLINIRNIKDTEKLNKIEDVKPILDKIVKDCGLNVVNVSSHQFEPIGVTMVYVLSESHLSIHTYPEKGIVYMDLFCCSETFDPETCSKCVTEIFEDSKIEILNLERL